MKLIVAVSENWGIGKDNGLLFNIPKDMKFFREMTLGKVVVLGRKNLESFPGAKPLPKRTNIILTKNPDFKKEGAICVTSTGELLSLGYDTDEMFVIGGEAIYKLLLPYCDTCYVTKVRAAADADRFMVNLDEHPDWALAEESEPVEDNGYELVFTRYERKQK